MKPKSLFRIILVFLLALIAFQLEAQLTITGEIRPRFEFRDGYKRLPDSTTTPAYLVTQRSRLGFAYKTDKLNTKITIQDVRTWGDELLKSDVPSVAIYEAWAEFPVSDSLFLRLGRQEFSYDNERLLSAGNWQQKGMTHDAALFKYHTNGWKIDFAAAFNQTGDPIFGTTYTGTSVKGNYKTLNFLWINKKFGQLNCSVLAIMDGFNQSPLKNTTYLRKTAGAILKYNIDGVTIALRGFSQMGNDSTGTKISAYYLNPDLFFGVKNCMFNPGMEYVSGNDYTDASNKKLNVFSTLYGSGHAFMGNMDYFCDMQKDTKSAGLIDIYLKTFYKLNEKTMLKADLHYFSLQNKYVDQTTGKTIDKPLGEELDLNCKYDMSKDVSMQFGYSVFSGTESNVIIRKGAITGFSGGGEEGKLGHWAFVMFTIKPTLFSSK